MASARRALAAIRSGMRSVRLPSCWLLLALPIPSIASARPPRSPGGPDAPIAPPMAFYAPWDGASLASLRDHGEQLHVVVPAWISVTGPDHTVTTVPDAAGRRVLASLGTRPKTWVMVQNALSGRWDGKGAASLFRDGVATSIVLDQIEAEAVRDRAAGLVIDFEDLPAGAQPDLLAFLAAVRTRCRPHRWTLAVTVPVANSEWDLAKLGLAADRLILMAYDEHWQTGQPGPIASDPWFATVTAKALTEVRPAHAIIAIASYAYDWPAKGPATILSIEAAKARASVHGVKPARDATSGGMHFDYSAAGVMHSVWMADASTVQRQVARANSSRAAGTALWRLGTEDPAIWHGPSRYAERPRSAPSGPSMISDLP